MFALLWQLFADDPAPKPGAAPDLFASPLFLLLMLVALFFFMFIRPMRRQEKERQTLLSSTEKNDRVLTNAGIYGTVVSISEKEDEVVVKVDDNTRLKMLKSSIARNLTKEEAAKAKGQTAEKK